MTSITNWNGHSGKLVDAKENFSLIDCEICQIKHIIPLPTTQELDQYYATHFYDKQKPNYFEQHKNDIDWWNLVYGERYERFERMLSAKGSILDIGCGPGFFLKLGKELGWKTLGIEPSPAATMYAKSLGLDVTNGILTPTNVEKLGTFDVVYMQGVMEHLPDPKSMIELCYKLLKPGGIFCTIVANDYNPFQIVLRDTLSFPSWWFVPPEHINYFSIESLVKLVKSIGFIDVNITTTFPIDIFLLMGDNYVGNDTIGKICHGKRKAFEFALDKSGMSSLKQQIYQNLAKLNIGRDIDATFMKPL